MTYECHVTTRVKYAPQAQQIADERGWKTSEIARDPLLGDDVYYYLTKHSPDAIGLHSDMDGVSTLLQEAGCEVLRRKI
jgi:hypothetical protein